MCMKFRVECLFGFLLMLFCVNCVVLCIEDEVMLWCDVC